MTTAQLNDIIKESKNMTESLCVLYEGRDIDYKTFLQHTSMKVRFLKKHVDNKNLTFYERMDITDVLVRHKSIVTKQSFGHLRLVQQG